VRRRSIYSAAIFLMVVLGIVGFAAHFFFRTPPSKTIPPFESYRANGTEGIFEALDRRVYDALLALEVRPENVDFKKVETRRSGQEEWTYSELLVRVTAEQTRTRINGVFSETLSHLTPDPMVQFAVGVHEENLVLVSLDGRPTHRITIIPLEATPAPSSISRIESANVAIIIDDIGYDYAMAKNFLELDGNLSFSILPYSPFKNKIAKAARDRGRDVLLHLPMEPLEFPDVNPGRGALLSSMTPDELINQLEKNIDDVPFALGVNNHMGSRLTQDSDRMRQIFTVLKKRNLFFVDSVTSSKSRCEQAARLLHLKFGRRQVFLDHIQTENAIRLQIKRLISIAKTRGYAIGIGHPYRVTWQVLQKELPRIQKEVNIIPVSALVG
jgi:polysaccharide deacetylase 2 family uncharacterized protein YibQ